MTGRAGRHPHKYRGTVTKISHAGRVISPVSFFFCLSNNFIYLFLAVLGLRCCAGFFSRIAESGSYSLVAVSGLLIGVASLVSEHGHMGFSSCNMWAQ